jgi:predicted permease
MKTLLQDIRYGWRMLAKTPGLTAVVAITLALGIATNALIFSIVNGYLLRPLPVPHPEQIAFVASEQKSSAYLFTFSYPDFLDFRSQAAPVADLFGFMPVLPGLSADGKADQILTSYVTGNYFTVLNVQPALGRFILPSEENQPGKAAVLVLGYSYWQKRFHGDRGVIGKQVRLNGKPAIVIGVVPKQFLGTLPFAEMDGYLPLASGGALEQSSGNLMQDRDSRIMRVMARLKPGVSIAQAQSSFNVIAQRLAKQYPATDKNVTVRVYREQLARSQPLGNNVIVAMAGFFLVLAALVLVLACMNVANVLLARATVRQREMGMRAALGASRARLIRQMLTESVLLGLLGGIGGILVGNWLNPGDLARLLMSSSLPLHLDVSFDWHVFAYAFGAAFLSGIVIGLWPAFRSSRTDVNILLQEGGRSDTPGAGRQRFRNFLVAAQVAGSLILLVIAALLVRSLQHAGNLRLGFDPGHVLNITVDPHQIGYNENQEREFYRQLEARVRMLPGIQSASLAFGTPMGHINIANGGAVSIDDHPTPSGQQPAAVAFNNVDPGYLETMRIPLLRGRMFIDLDNQNAPPVAIVNETMADKFWPHEDPIGKRFSMKPLNAPPQSMQVVGVTATGKYGFITEDPTALFYVPMAQNFISIQTLQVRTSGAPESLVVPVRNEIHKLAPDLPIVETSTMQQMVEGTNGLQLFRFAAYFAAAIGGLGLFLAVLGVYGVVSFGAMQRTREIGIRIALGGSERDVLRLVLRQGVRMVVAGLLIGVLAALALTRVMTRYLLDVSPSDPLTYASVALVLTAVALAACWIPARRAARVDPGAALRYE